MENMKLFFDKLSERDVIDRWAFLVFATVGSAAIWALKYISVDPIIVATGAALLMICYAAIAGTGATKLRADQAGDNCYYLGLIYTLASLAFAIFTFDPANTATTIVQGFGVALATTVLGLVLRVFFSQSRVDLVDAEETARVALTDAANQVRAQMTGVVQAFSSFAHHTQQHLQELRDQVVIDLEAAGQASRDAIKGAADEAIEAVQSQANESAAATKKVTTGVGRLVSTLESHAYALTEIEAKSRAQLTYLEAFEKAMASTQTLLSQIGDTASGLKADQSELISNSERFASSADAIETAARQFEEVVSRRVEELREVPVQNAEAAEASMREVTKRWTEVVDLIADKHRDLLKNLEESHSKQVSAISRHNDDLELELARSRDYVGKLNGTLVDVAKDITRQLQDTPAT